MCCCFFAFGRNKTSGRRVWWKALQGYHHIQPYHPNNQDSLFYSFLSVLYPQKTLSRHGKDAGLDDMLLSAGCDLGLPNNTILVETPSWCDQQTRLM